MKPTKKRSVASGRPAAAERLKGETVPPIKTLQLMAAIGVSKTARTLGVSTTTLHKARNHNLVSRVIEVASAGALREIGAGEATGMASPAMTDGEARRGKAAIVLEVDPSQEPALDSFAKAIGARVVFRA